MDSEAVPARPARKAASATAAPQKDRNNTGKKRAASRDVAGPSAEGDSSLTENDEEAVDAASGPQPTPTNPDPDLEVLRWIRAHKGAAGNMVPAQFVATYPGNLDRDETRSAPNTRPTSNLLPDLMDKKEPKAWNAAKFAVVDLLNDHENRLRTQNKTINDFTTVLYGMHNLLKQMEADYAEVAKELAEHRKLVQELTARHEQDTAELKRVSELARYTKRQEVMDVAKEAFSVLNKPQTEKLNQISQLANKAKKQAASAQSTASTTMNKTQTWAARLANPPQEDAQPKPTPAQNNKKKLSPLAQVIRDAKQSSRGRTKGSIVVKIAADPDANDSTETEIKALGDAITSAHKIDPSQFSIQPTRGKNLKVILRDAGPEDQSAWLAKLGNDRYSLLDTQTWLKGVYSGLPSHVTAEMLKDHLTSLGANVPMLPLQMGERPNGSKTFRVSFRSVEDLRKCVHVQIDYVQTALQDYRPRSSKSRTPRDRTRGQQARA